MGSENAFVCEKTGAMPLVCLGDVGKAQIRPNQSPFSSSLPPSPQFEANTKLAERQQVANMEVLNCSLKNDRE